MKSILRLRCLRSVQSLLCLSLSCGAHAELTARQNQLLIANCVQCHARPETKAPLMGLEKDWQLRLQAGEATLVRHVVEGVGGMPALGYCAACNEADFHALARRISGLDGTP